MVDFKYWLENIVESARLIASEDALNRAWIHGDRTVTSAYAPNELFEQLLGDLLLRQHVQIFEESLRHMGAYGSIVTFATALLDVEAAISTDPRLEDPARLLVSPVWVGLRTAAKPVSQLPRPEDF